MHAWRIAFTTVDPAGRPEVAVTTLLVPQGEWTGPGPRPAVSLQTPEDSAESGCAPSVTLARTVGGDERDLLARGLDDCGSR
ncbi:hypothetical protein KO481_22470 [Nocardia sp. NEAU-G5]|uniref:Uncharacterized protein n=1 Tax=Nocardia albiluteola TaxID=2842303 RepID=A0ABS6B209_9NOCA|nr:hypothetical protein [Nocardia albiluteola]MBU3064284.1 hypothetical protein [Nocardia albiluteola]